MVRLFLAVLVLVLVVGAVGAQTPPQVPALPQAPPLERRVSDLERRMAAVEAKLGGAVVPAVGTAAPAATGWQQPAAAPQVMHPVGSVVKGADGGDLVCTANGTWQPVAAAAGAVPVNVFGAVAQPTAWGTTVVTTPGVAGPAAFQSFGAAPAQSGGLFGGSVCGPNGCGPAAGGFGLFRRALR